MTCFELKTPNDLFKKAEEDLASLQQSPSDSKIAFNLFVTIEHIPDWLNKRSLVTSSAILRTISHIANGAKHFTLNEKRHRSVDRTELERVYEKDVYEEGVFYEPLMIWLSTEEEKQIGKKKISAIELAQLALDFWQEKM